MKRLFNIFKASQPMILDKILICESAGKPMQSVDQAHCNAHLGIQGDRYHHATGHWHRVESCQITLIGELDLKKAQKSNFSDDFHRRNLVIKGIYSHQFKGKTLQIGEVILRYWKPRPPCGYLDQVSGKGASKLLGKHCGICLKVVKGGIITVNDSINILPIETFHSR